MTDIDCLHIKPRTTSFDRPNISVVVGAAAGNATMRIRVACFNTCLLLKVVRLTRVWNAGMDHSSAEKSRAPPSRKVKR